MKISTEALYTYEQMMQTIQELERTYPDKVKVESIGRSPQNRDLPLLIITDRTKSHEQKPAYYLQANVHASEAMGTSSLLHVACALCEQKQHEELLMHIAFYIVPRVNPDGTEQVLTTCYVPRSRNTVKKKQNHIIPSDINGDGLILSMRKRSDSGRFCAYEEDERLLVPRKDDHKGPFFTVTTEGMIHDWTGGEYFDQAVDSVDFNRNYPINWNPTLSVSGRYPFSEPETRAVGDFLLQRSNIFAGMDVHNGSNAVFRPGSSELSQFDDQDVKVMDEVGEICSKITGFPYLVDGYRTEKEPPVKSFSGNSTEFAYFLAGISFYVLELGNGFNQMGLLTKDFILNGEYSKNPDAYMAKLMKYHDEAGSEDLFRPWTKFSHPQLGEVEIGGVFFGHAYGIRFPYPASILENATRFYLEHADMRAKLRWEQMRVEHIQADVFSVSATLTNEGRFAANVMHASKGRPISSPVTISLDLPSDVQHAAGEPLKIFRSNLQPKERMNFQWVVRNEQRKPVQLKADHPKADSACVTLDFGE